MKLRTFRYWFLAVGLLLVTQWVFVDSNAPMNNAAAPAFFLKAPPLFYHTCMAAAVVGALFMILGMFLVAQATEEVPAE